MTDLVHSARPPRRRGPRERGDVIDGRFEIVRELGAGAMGRVYLAKQLSLDILRAVKVIRGSGEESDVIRFRREAKAMSRLQHARIAQVIDFGSLDDGTLYLAMEFVAGRSLHERVKELGPLRVGEGIAVLTAIGEAIAYGHAQGIVHRDLKPQNVLLHSNDVDQVKVIDFGLAKVVTGDAVTDLTGDHELLGTPMFMSPEQCLCREVGPPADVYALAGVGYFCFSGRPVFNARTVTAAVLAHANEPPGPLAERCPDMNIPLRLEELLLASLAKEPGERPTAAELVDTLKSIAAERLARGARSVITQLPLPPPPPSVAEILSSADATALAIWREEDDGGGPESHREEALLNQISGLLLEFAKELQHNLDMTASIRLLAERIEHLEETITTAEMDLALIGEQIGSDDPLQARQAEETAAELNAEIEQLRVTMNRKFRNLYKFALSFKSEVHEPGLLEYYDELYRLAEAYLLARARSRQGEEA